MSLGELISSSVELHIFHLKAWLLPKRCWRMLFSPSCTTHRAEHAPLPTLMSFPSLSLPFSSQQLPAHFDFRLPLLLCGMNLFRSAISLSGCGAAPPGCLCQFCQLARRFTPTVSVLRDERYPLFSISADGFWFIRPMGQKQITWAFTAWPHQAFYFCFYCFVGETAVGRNSIL